MLTSAAPATHRPRAAWIWLFVLASLLAVRVPSLVQPAGGDQGLYGYAGQRLLAGATPYKDTWDQKPPGIAFLYASLWRVWPHESVVPAADLAAAAIVASLLVLLGWRRFTTRIGFAAAALFLLLGDPSIQRNGGVYVRGQCEPFIALAVTAALLLVASRERRRWHLLLAGACLAAAFWLKYNAIVYGVPVVVALWAWASDTRADRRALVRNGLWVTIGFILVCVGVIGYFASHGALSDLYLATVVYNVSYAGEAYGGVGALLVYPVTIAVGRAQVDLLWYVAGLGAALLAWRIRADRSIAVTLAWLAAAIISIEINGRDLPNYFVQANAPLALTAAAGLATLGRRPAWLQYAVATLLLLGLWRVGDEPVRGPRLGGLPQAVANVRFDAAYALGRIDRSTYLARFKGSKFDAREIDDLAGYLRTTPASAPVFVFGFSGGSACWKSERVSASRFFWSRPVIVEFAAARPDYGSAGLLADLQRRPPSVVALQKEDWRSQAFFLGNPRLRAWLDAGYLMDHETSMFTVWRRKT